MYGNINNYCIQQFQYCFNFSNSKEINHNHSHNKSLNLLGVYSKFKNTTFI